MTIHNDMICIGIDARRKVSYRHTVDGYAAAENEFFSLPAGGYAAHAQVSIDADRRDARIPI